MRKKVIKTICIMISFVMFLGVFAQMGSLSVRADDGVVTVGGHTAITGEEFDKGYDPAKVVSSPEDEQALINEWVSRKPLMASAAGSYNETAGIKINLDTKSTGMYSWTPGFVYNQIERSSDWVSFFTTDMSTLKAGDVIVWEDDYSGGALVNHVAIIVEVAKDHSWYLCVDGNCPVNENRPTGIDFVLRTTLQKKGSSSGHVAIWRNLEHGEEIALSASKYTENVINTMDMSFNNEYNSIGWGWCYCYVVEVLLATKSYEELEAIRIAQERFSDVIDQKSSDYRPIQWAADMGIVRGYKDGTFKPQDPCTREQFVVMLWRMAGRPEVGIPDMEGWTPFSDVSLDMSSFKAICWASDADIIRGYQDGTFKPDDPLTRAQIVVIVWRMLGRQIATRLSSFPDAGSSDPNYRAIQWAAQAGVIRGFKDGTFKPYDNCTRAQLATILYRAVRSGLLTVENASEESQYNTDSEDNVNVDEADNGDNTDNQDNGATPDGTEDNTDQAGNAY